LKRESSYKTILENVQDKSPRDFWRDGKDDHEELMVTLGAILRRGDASLRDWTMNIIKQRAHYSQPERFKKNEEISIILPKTDYVTDPLACGEDIKALKEYGDQIGEVPKYKEVSIQAKPPRFRSILCFKGQVFEAEGKRKKIARQNVAHKACNVLSVVVGE
jgi:dsRNA-specific ribonuclease